MEKSFCVLWCSVMSCPLQDTCVVSYQHIDTTRMCRVMSYLYDTFGQSRWNHRILSRQSIWSKNQMALKQTFSSGDETIEFYPGQRAREAIEEKIKWLLKQTEQGIPASGFDIPVLQSIPEHSSEIRCLHSAKCSREMLQN